MESKCADWEKQPKGSLVQAGGLMRRVSDVMSLKGVRVEELPEGFVVALMGAALRASGLRLLPSRSHPAL